MNSGTAKVEVKSAASGTARRPSNIKSPTAHIGGQRVTAVYNSRGQVERYVDPKSGRTVQETINVTQDRSGRIGTGPTRVTRTPEGTVFERGPGISQGTVERSYAPEQARPVSPAPAQQSIGGERIARSYTVGGQRIVETESGKEFIDVGGGDYIKNSKNSFQLREMFKDRARVSNELQARQEINKWPEVVREAQSLFLGATRAGPETIVGKYFGGDDRPFMEAFKENLRDVENKAFVARSEAIMEGRKTFSEPGGYSRKQAESMKYFEFPTVDIATVVIPTSLPKAGITGAFSGRGGTMAQVGEQAGYRGIRPQTSLRTIGSIIKRPPVRSVSKTDYTGASLRGDESDTFVLNTDTAVKFRGGYRGRSRQDVIVRGVSQGESTGGEAVSSSTGAGDLSARRVILPRGTGVGAPKISKLSPQVDYGFTAQARSKANKDAFVYSQSGRLAEKGGAREVSYEGRGIGTRNYQISREGLVELRGLKVPGTKEREVGIFRTSGESGFKDFGISKSGKEIGADFGKGIIYEREAPAGLVPKYEGGGGLLTKQTSRQTGTAAMASAQSRLAVKAARKVVAPVFKRNLPRITRSAGISKVVTPRFVRRRESRFRTAAAIGRALYQSVYDRFQPTDGREIYSTVNPYFRTTATKRLVTPKIKGLSGVKMEIGKRAGSKGATRARTFTESMTGVRSGFDIGVLRGQVPRQVTGTRTVTATKTTTRTTTTARPRGNFFPRPPRTPIRFRLPPFVPRFDAGGRRMFRGMFGARPAVRTLYKPSLTARFVRPVASAPKVTGGEIRPFVRTSKSDKRKVRI